VIIFLPLVLAYQTWTYYCVFRRRISRQEFQPSPPRGTPIGALRSPLASPLTAWDLRPEVQEDASDDAV